MSEGRQRVSLDAQIKAARDAFRQRETAILYDVRSGKTRELVGQTEVNALHAALETLLWTQKYEARIKAKVAGASS